MLCPCHVSGARKISLLATAGVVLMMYAMASMFFLYHRAGGQWARGQGQKDNVTSSLRRGEIFKQTKEDRTSSADKSGFSEQTEEEERLSRFAPVPKGETCQDTKRWLAQLKNPAGVICQSPLSSVGNYMSYLRRTIGLAQWLNATIKINVRDFHGLEIMLQPRDVNWISSCMKDTSSCSIWKLGADVFSHHYTQT
eukprot:s3750_g5.t1